MMIPWGFDSHKKADYKEYKAEKFEKTKQKVLNILKGIEQTSLKQDDKNMLIEEIKNIVANF